MKNILIPTDFSAAAENAFRFAQDLFASEDVKFTVAHFFMPALITDMAHPPVAEYIETWQKTAEEQLAAFVRKIQTDTPGTVATETTIGQLVIPGFAAEEIVRLSGAPEVDLVIMGATGEKGWVEKLFGSVSLHVAQHAQCPVLLVPESVCYETFSEVVYASNYDDDDEAMLRRAARIAGLSSAHIHLVHVTEEAAPVYVEHAFEARQLFKKDFPDLSFRIARIEGDDVPHALETYASKHEANLVIITGRQRSFFKNLLHKSMTKAVAFNTRTPLLVLHSDN